MNTVPLSDIQDTWILWMLLLHAQAQNEHWHMLAEERAAIISSLRAELQDAQVMTRCLVRLYTSNTCVTCLTPRSPRTWN